MRSPCLTTTLRGWDCDAPSRRPNMQTHSRGRSATWVTTWTRSTSSSARWTLEKPRTPNPCIRQRTPHRPHPSPRTAESRRSRRDARLALARAIVRAKIEAMVRRLRNVQAAAEIRADLTGLSAAATEATSPESARGVEGAATKRYYEGFALRIRNPDFSFAGRSRRPPRDPLNSLMSFAYTLVFGEVQSALLAHGLDPHPALLHDLHRNHPALASDLAEPYRVLVADSLVLTLVNQKRVSVDGFEQHTSGAVWMTAPTRNTMLAAYEAFLTAPLGGAKGSVSPRRLIDGAASAMLRVVLGEDDALRLPLGGDDLENSTSSLTPDVVT